MRVLMVNAFHYLRGGVERTYFDESRWLEAAGHEVGHFAIRDPRNRPSPTSQWFAPPADFGEQAPATRQIAQLPRALWSAPAAAAMRGLLGAFRPDVAHVHAPSRYLTPSVLRELERAGVPMVMTLHDFKPWCTNRVMFAREAPCERCRGGRHIEAARVACVQHSRAKSLVGAAEAYLHDRLGAYRAIRRWIAPSRFVRDKVIEHGLAPERIRVLPHGLEPAAAPAPPAAGEPYALYAGRLSEEKGVRLLPAIALRLAPHRLVVAGGGPLAGWLERQASSLPNLELAGHLEGDAFTRRLAGAGAVVVPSLFYETFCYAAAEALLAARPVVASRIGAIPELVEHESTGLLVPPGDPHAAAEAATRALTDPAAAGWGRDGRERVLKLGAPAAHVAGLGEVYREAIGAG